MSSKPRLVERATNGAACCDNQYMYESMRVASYGSGSTPSVGWQPRRS
jgi:hypothetical protein